MQAQWIWNFGDFEIWLHERLSMGREERRHQVPPFWYLPHHDTNVVFRKTVYLEQEEGFSVLMDGIGYWSLNGKRFTSGACTLPPGEHQLCIAVMNPTNVPSVFVAGNHIATGPEWECSVNDGIWRPVGYWNFFDPSAPPSAYTLPYREITPAAVTRTNGGVLLDFGKETFIRLQFSGVQQPLSLFYGESEPEVFDGENCVIQCQVKTEDLLPARAGRYVFIKGNYRAVKAFYEYLPLGRQSSFQCGDPELDQIYQTALYTLELTSREFFIDGIKRDRWVWSGDAYQSHLLNYYSFFDQDITKRTIIALRGKEPVLQHINTILDYSFYWFLSIADYYRYTGDTEFIKNIYEKMESLMDFCLKRRDERGFASGRPGDWVFIDWADMDKAGTLCAEQILLWKALDAMHLCALLVQDRNASRYKALRDQLKVQINQVFWDEEQGGFVTNDQTRQIRRHANIFAIIYDFADTQQQKAIIQHVLRNPQVPAINTPYFKFFELDAFCKLGCLNEVTQMMKQYWGGMLRQGATSFWEEFDPQLEGEVQLAMYGMPFDKSLCHAWGASPLYLLGRYYFGVTPEEDGFFAAPQLGGLERIEGEVPVCGGTVLLQFDEKELILTASGAKGRVTAFGKTVPVAPGQTIRLTNGPQP